MFLLQFLPLLKSHFLACNVEELAKKNFKLLLPRGDTIAQLRIKKEQVLPRSPLCLSALRNGPILFFNFRQRHTGLQLKSTQLLQDGRHFCDLVTCQRAGTCQTVVLHKLAENCSSTPHHQREGLAGHVPVARMTIISLGHLLTETAKVGIAGLGKMFSLVGHRFMEDGAFLENANKTTEIGRAHV